MDRRSFLSSSVGGLAAAAGVPARAQDIAEGTLHIHAGFPPGSAVDALARSLAERARQDLGRTVLVVNQPGATGIISLERVKRAPADGTAIAVVPLASALIAPLFKSKVDFNFVADFEPIMMVGHYAMAFSVANRVPVEDWRGFLEWAKANPQELNYGHGGPGSTGQLAGAAIAGATGLKFQDVPYKGDAEGLSALIGGQLQTIVTSTVAVSANYQAKRVKTLAVTSRVRVPSMPDVPTLAELGYPAAVIEPWMGIFAPKGTPPRAIALWNKTLNAALTNPAFRQTLATQGYAIAGGPPEDLKTAVAADAVRWRKVMDASGFKPLD